MLTPYLPFPPSSGGQIRSYNLIKNLANKHEITLFSLIKNDNERKFIGELEKYCKKVRVFKRPAKPWTLKNILRTGFSLYPFVVVRNLSGEEKRALIEELKIEKYDLIHAETFYVMPHLPKTDTPILLVDQTIEFQVYQHYVEELSNFFLKPLFYMDVLKIKFCELRFWRKANQVVAVSEDDKKKMLSFVKDLKVSVVPNGAGEDLMNVWGKRTPESIPTVFFQANFNWMQNIEAAQSLAREVFPLIQRKIKNVRCWIVGQEAREKIGDLKTENLEVINLETQDTKGVIDAYKKATVFIAPLKGPGGTRLKILGAMAAGVPVVTTRVGIEGIDAQADKQVLVADDWDQMAEEVVRLITDKKLYERVVSSARDLVEEKYSYKSIAKILDQIYREVGNEKD